jgi:hypothetical protein
MFLRVSAATENLELHAWNGGSILCRCWLARCAEGGWIPGDDLGFYPN